MLNQAVKIVEEHDSITIFANGTRYVFERDMPFDNLVNMFHDLHIDDVTYEDKSV